MGSMTVQSPNFIQKLFGSTAPATPAATPAAASTTAYSADTVQVAGTSADPNTQSAGFWKKTSDVFGQMFSDMAYNMHMGDTYELVRREFQQVDRNYDGTLDKGEFMLATLNPFDYQAADHNYDGRITLSEYADYRKNRIELSFKQKDVNGDRHLNIAEIGTVGRWYMANHDARLDANQDGLVNKREYVRAQLTLGISLRDMFGF